MKELIRKQLRIILESMPNELIGQVWVNIPFNNLVLDKVNLEWAIENITEKRPSRSTDKPMQVAMSRDKKYYLLDGYHRLVEAVMNGKTNTKGILLNKSYEELKSMNKIGVGCSGGSGDEFCSNFKNLGSLDMIKSITEQMIDGQNMNQGTQTACNKMSVATYDEGIKLITAAIGTPEQNPILWQHISKPLNNWKQANNSIGQEVKTLGMSGDSMVDESNTYWHQIQTTICEQGPNFQ
jgi:hypothetical protein